MILDDHDRPGLLAEILTSFASRHVELSRSIISRPTKIAFGRYNFFIDINGHINDASVSAAIKESVNEWQKLKIWALSSRGNHLIQSMFSQLTSSMDIPITLIL
ncbi:hypothetical protein P4S72_12970 [Vibrio sp. PP-XX7]